MPHSTASKNKFRKNALIADDNDSRSLKFDEIEVQIKNLKKATNCMGKKQSAAYQKKQSRNYIINETRNQISYAALKAAKVEVEEEAAATPAAPS